MKTSHKRAGEHMTRDFINRENLRNAQDDLDNIYVLDKGISDKRLLLGMGEAAAHEITIKVLNENIRRAELPFKRPNQVDGTRNNT